MYLSLAAALLLGEVKASSTGRQCHAESIQAVLPPNATVLYALPQGSGASYGDQNIAYPLNATNLPAFCAVLVNVTSSPTTSFTFGLGLPDEWNERYLAVGNGGFSGGINWLDLGAGLHYGFATMSTDTGHSSTIPDGTWAYNEPEKLNDWGYRAMHESVVLSKQIVAAFYKQDIAYSYYSGCSTGGRQGLKEIQLHPGSFDGVLAGAPAWWTRRLQTWSAWIGKLNSDHPAGSNLGRIPASLFPIIAAEVMRQCDPSDGLVDGIITDPKMCHFQHEALLCKASSSATEPCLTSAQLGTLYQIYHPYMEANNTFIAPGMQLGSEAEWPVLLGDPNGGCPLGFGYVQNYLGKGPEWSWKDFDYSIVQLADATDPGASSADDYDLSPFQAKGGKLLQYHGYADAYIPPGMSVYFYERVLHTLVPKGLELDDWYRLFLVPGAGHCSGSANGAPWYFAGANQAGKISTGMHSVPGFSDARHDVLLALMAWTEEGIAPDQLIATKWHDDKPELGIEKQRPLCPYPTMSQYVGGDVNEASSFTCGSLPFRAPEMVQPAKSKAVPEAGSIPGREL